MFMKRKDFEKQWNRSGSFYRCPLDFEIRHMIEGEGKTIIYSKKKIMYSNPGVFYIKFWEKLTEARKLYLEKQRSGWLTFKPPWHSHWTINMISLEIHKEGTYIKEKYPHIPYTLKE